MSRSLLARLYQSFASRYRVARGSVDAQSRLFSRRAVLAASAQIGAACLLSSESRSLFAATTPRRVIVVGAGFAGLSAASELHAAGYDVQVFDARTRISGRVLSLTDAIPGKSIEAGGELIGANHPRWNAYAKKFGLEFRDITEGVTDPPRLFLQGQLQSPEKLRQLFDATDAALSSLNPLAKTIDPEQPWNSPSAKELDARSMADWLAEQRLEQDARVLLRQYIESENGVTCEKSSMLGMLAMIAGGGVEDFWEQTEAFTCKGGGQQLALHLAQTLPANSIHLKLPVKKIQYSTEQKSCTVTTADDRQWTADHVILAIPSSLYTKIEFTPALPAELKPQMGTALKYLMFLKHRYWIDDKHTPEAVTDQHISMVWEGTASQHNMPPDAPKIPQSLIACQTAFSGGPSAVQALKLTDKDRDETYKALMAQVFPGFTPHYVDKKFIAWPNDPFTQGGYSFPAPGDVTRVSPLLHTGIGNLHFAGEHCSPGFIGYMEGALESGTRIAREIAKTDSA